MGNKGALLVVLALVMSLALNVGSAAAKNRKHKSRPTVAVARLNSSALFTVHGKVYPDGLFYVELNIGDPPKPYSLDIDTGSDLTWLKCHAPFVTARCSPGPHPLYRFNENKGVLHKDPLCTSLRNVNRRQSSSGLCDYEIAYADQGSSRGVLVKDAFNLSSPNGFILQPDLAFGCGYDQQDSTITSPFPTDIDGVLGLGCGKSSIVSQLDDLGITRNVFGHCFSGQGGGYLFFGDGYVPFPRVTWTPMSRNPKYYSPGPANLFFGKQPMGVKDLPVVFDSGSSYTYFKSWVYEAFISKVKKDLAGKKLKEALEDQTLPLCWKGTRSFKSVLDVKKFFKPLVLVFADGKRAKLEIPPEGYLIISSNGNACMGILNGTEAQLGDLNIIGDISMQELMVIYDNEQQQIGWVPMDCLGSPNRNRLPNCDDGFNDRFSQPYVASMGILTD